MTYLRSACTIAMFVAVASIPRTLMAATTVSGNISTNTEWTTANSPYVVNCGVDVISNATLTIDAGVVVKFYASTSHNCELSVESGSTIVAVGTATAPIVFTSYYDDTVGGDTDGDGGAISPHAGDWYAVEMWGGTGTFTYTVFTYGGYGSSNSTYGALYVYGGTTTVDHSHFSTNQCSGIYLADNSTVHVSHTELNGNGNGISVLHAYLDLKLNSNVHDNSDTGVWVSSIGYTGTATAVQNSDVKNNGNYGVYLQVYPGDPEPWGHENNIYNNAGGSSSNASQLSSYYLASGADWTNNYWGDTVQQHTCQSSHYHLYWNTTYNECVPTALGGPGPTSYTEIAVSDNTCLVSKLRYCATDNVNVSTYVTTKFNNSGL